MNIYAESHGAHIGLVAKLLRINDFLLIAPPCNFIWQDSYTYTLDLVVEWSKEYQEYKLWKWYLETQFISGTPNENYINIYIQDRETLDDTVYSFLTALHDNNIITDLQGYMVSSKKNRIAIRKTIQMVLDIEPTADQVEFWNEQTGRNLSKKIDYFSFLMMLTFGIKGKSLGLHLPFVQLFKSAKYQLNLDTPSVALILCGHSRNFIKHSESHKSIIDNIYIDIFIHTWSKQGPRTYTGESDTRYINVPTDMDLIRSIYKPIKYSVEELNIKRLEFSLLDNHSLLFFDNNQPKDDASFYVNADLYSLYKASLLIKDFENEKGYLYKSVMKIPFIYTITGFDFHGICKDLSNDINSIWLPNNGCKRCSMEIAWPYLYKTLHHTEHSNNLDVFWMYGKRDAMLYACELYLHAFAIADNVLDDNIESYVNVAKYKKYRNFIYIFGEEYIEKKFYNINSLPVRINEFSIQNLFRIYMTNYFCSKSVCITGNFDRFDSDRHLCF